MQKFHNVKNKIIMHVIIKLVLILFVDKSAHLIEEELVLFEMQ